MISSSSEEDSISLSIFSPYILLSLFDETIYRIKKEKRSTFFNAIPAPLATLYSSIRILQFGNEQFSLAFIDIQDIIIN